MAKRANTVGELRALLASYSDDTVIAVAGAPDVNGFVNPILAIVGTSEDLPRTVILALGEEVLGHLGEGEEETGEVGIAWPQRPI